MVYATFRIEAYLSGSWTNLGSDVLKSEPIRTTRGMTGWDPNEVTARPGTMQFALRNDAGNSGGKVGYYSPGHADCRTGWGKGVFLRLIATFSGTDYKLWHGRTLVIRTVPGTLAERRVYVVAQDLFGDMADTTLRELDVQINATDVTCLTEVNSNLPSGFGFGSTTLSYFGGGDTFPYAFDDFKKGISALAAIDKVVKSTRGIAFPTATWQAGASPEWRYLGRNILAARSSSGAFTASDVMVDGDFRVTDHLVGSYNLVRVTTHLRSIDSVNTTVLYSATAPIPIGPLETIEVWGNYRDGNNDLIGAYDFTGFTAGVDVIANSAADGSGTNETGSIDGTGTTPFASSTKFVLFYGRATQAYITTLQIRGRGIHDNGDAIAEAKSGNGERPIEIDMPYQNDPNVGQALADYVLAQYSGLVQIPERITINAQQSSALMLHAIQREIGDLITLTETVTGLSAAECLIRGVDYEISDGAFKCFWNLAPARTTRAWVLDDANLSVLDSTTILGYA